MVVVPRLHEMKYSETRQSDSENYWTNEILENRFWRQFPAYYRQINVIRSKLIWTSWRPHLKIWAYGLKFLDVYTPKRALLKTLATIHPWRMDDIQTTDDNHANSSTVTQVRSAKNAYYHTRWWCVRNPHHRCTCIGVACRSIVAICRALSRRCVDLCVRIRNTWPNTFWLQSR